MASENWVDRNAFAKVSMIPSKTPPSMAPGMEPMPPSTAAVKARMPGMEPVVGWSTGMEEHISTPATAASAEPMAKVMEMVLLTLMKTR